MTVPIRPDRRNAWTSSSGSACRARVRSLLDRYDDLVDRAEVAWADMSLQRGRRLVTEADKAEQKLFKVWRQCGGSAAQLRLIRTVSRKRDRIRGHL